MASIDTIAQPIAGLQGLGPERVIYIGSASKILAPALRVGWILTPAGLVHQLLLLGCCRLSRRDAIEGVKKLAALIARRQPQSS
jgi:hypothetical protein